MKMRIMNVQDLTLPLKEGMLTFPSLNHPKVEVKVLGKITKAGRATRKLVLGTHTGTHIDAPAHFIENGTSVDKLDLKVLIGPARMIDLKGFRGAIEPFHLRELDNLAHIERLIIRTGWSKKYNSADYYTGYPYFSSAACKYIVRRKIKLLGLDFPSPDNPRDNFYSENDSPNHKYFFKHRLILVEYLTNLEKITVSDFSIAALPLNIYGADGAPARVVAFWR